jgi:hypothetical protein
MHSPAATCVRLKEALLVLLRVGDPELHDDTLQIRSMSDGGQSAYAVTLRLPTTLSIAARLSRITGRLILANEQSFLLFEHNVQAILSAAAMRKETLIAHSAR